jgi:hypothetical protein
MSVEFDLFAFLGQLNAGKLTAYEDLSEEAQKAASPFVISRWLVGTSDPGQIIRMNAFVNPYVFPLGAEKNLLFKLMAASCTGPKRVSYMKPPGSTSKNPKLAVEVVMKVYDCSSREANHLLGLMSADDVLQCAEQAGLDKAEMTKLKAEYKDSDGSRGTTKERKKPATKR